MRSSGQQDELSYVLFVSHSPTQTVAVVELAPRPLLSLIPLQYARNRLSKFQYYAGDPDATRDSEEVLLESAEKTRFFHNGGWVGFKPNDYGNYVSRQRGSSGLSVNFRSVFLLLLL